MAKNTGIMLSEARGPLNNLLDNLSGQHGEYWLDALKKLLRKEKLPEPPKELLSWMNALDSRSIAKKKLRAVVKALKTIPSVCDAYICDPDDDGDLINIEVYPNLTSFILENTLDGTTLFILRPHGVIDHCLGDEFNDKKFKEWNKNEYADISIFCKALVELSEIYQQAVPVLQ